jgi:plastocyanin
MKRREFVTSVLATGLATPALAAKQEHDHGRPLGGPLANAVVSFGAWLTEPPLDRFPAVAPAPTANAHVLLPHEVKITAGGAVSFVIAGLHNVQVFGPGTKPDDINTALTTPMTAPPGLAIINDSTNRLYRGPDPSLLLPTLDRVETVHFAKPGRYLVICGVLLHFQDNMFGYVRVLPSRNDE